MNKRRKIIKMLFSIMGIIFGVLFIGLLAVLINSPGKLAPLKDEQGNVIQNSVSEKIWIEVNGIKQGMFIRGENPKNPIILYVHGGPGTPMFQFTSYFEKRERLEKYFTVCYWEQRGSGMSYSKSIDPSTMTVDQMVEDAREVTEYLKSRFGQDKIYIQGHSWGSYLGVKIIEKHPENYLAYVGIGQVAYGKESERLAYDYMLNHAKDINDKDVIAKLEQYNPNADDFPTLEYLVRVRTNALEKYKIGRIHQGVAFQDILKAFFIFKGYTLREKINWFVGEGFSLTHLMHIAQNDNLFESSVKFEVPFYIIHGDYDYMCSQVLAKKYLDVIDAPKKEFFAFTNSAHSPNMEEPERFIEVFRKIASENFTH